MSFDNCSDGMADDDASNNSGQRLNVRRWQIFIAIFFSANCFKNNKRK